MQEFIPKHVAIIPDGNRRWARQQKLGELAGHQHSAETIIPQLIEKAAEMGISYLTFWVLSTENIAKRKPYEISGLYFLIERNIKKALNEFKKNGVRMKLIGDIDVLPKNIGRDLNKIVEDTKQNDKITVTIALNYGGKDEIIRAINKLIKSQPKEPLTSELFSNFLDTREIPDPDLIIRTGKEQRLSGFMLWQSEYSELAFPEVFFPDFTSHQFEKVIEEYANRKRRFGK